jgi:hypothetical protein
MNVLDLLPVALGGPGEELHHVGDGASSPVVPVLEHVVGLDSSTWASEADLHRDIARALNFPSYYGHNLDALSDQLHAIANYESTTLPKAAGFVLALTGYDSFAKHCPFAAQTVLDIFGLLGELSGWNWAC